jgi:hypothetical protein
VCKKSKVFAPIIAQPSMQIKSHIAPISVQYEGLCLCQSQVFCWSTGGSALPLIWVQVATRVHWGLHLILAKRPRSNYSMRYGFSFIHILVHYFQFH